MKRQRVGSERERQVGEDPGKEVGNEALARNGITRRTVTCRGVKGKLNS